MLDLFCKMHRGVDTTEGAGSRQDAHNTGAARCRPASVIAELREHLASSDLWCEYPERNEYGEDPDDVEATTSREYSQQVFRYDLDLTCKIHSQD